MLLLLVAACAPVKPADTATPDTAARACVPGVEVPYDGADQDCDGGTDEDCAACDRAVPEDHTAIQEAIEAASAGDVVCVAPGTYLECVDFVGSAITLLGPAGAAGAYVYGGAPTITDLVARGTASHGGGYDGFGYGFGGGVYVDGGVPADRTYACPGRPIEGSYEGTRAVRVPSRVHTRSLHARPPPPRPLARPHRRPGRPRGRRPRGAAPR